MSLWEKLCLYWYCTALTVHYHCHDYQSHVTHEKQKDFFLSLTGLVMITTYT